MSAQFYEAARAATPDLQASIATGDTAPLHSWLVDNVYRHGSTYAPAELVERATGKPLSTDAYLTYLRTKFGDIYDLA